MSDVKPIPDGCNTVNAYLVVPNTAEAIAFYEKAFGATAGMKMHGPDGSSIVHAEIHLGNSTVMLTDENPAWGMKSSQALGGSPVSMHLCVEDADAFFDKAVQNGCEVVAPMENMFWGDRFGKFMDPFGLQWSVATHVEDVPPEEMMKRAQEAFANMDDPHCNPE